MHAFNKNAMHTPVSKKLEGLDRDDTDTGECKVDGSCFVLSAHDCKTIENTGGHENGVIAR